MTDEAPLDKLYPEYRLTIGGGIDLRGQPADLVETIINGQTHSFTVEWGMARGGGPVGIMFWNEFHKRCKEIIEDKRTENLR